MPHINLLINLPAVLRLSRRRYNLTLPPSFVTTFPLTEQGCYIELQMFDL